MINANINKMPSKAIKTVMSMLADPQLTAAGGEHSKQTQEQEEPARQRYQALAVSLPHAVKAYDMSFT